MTPISTDGLFLVVLFSIDQRDFRIIVWRSKSAKSIAFCSNDAIHGAIPKRSFFTNMD